MVCAFFEKYRHGKSVDRRNHILDAAFEVFIEKGMTNAKMEDIARAAGYGKSTLYEYFSGKDDILAESLRINFTERYRLIARNAESEPAPAGKLKAFLLGEMEMVIEYGGKEQIEGIFMSNPDSVLTSSIFKTLDEIILFKFEHIAGYIMEGIKEGSFRKTDPYIAASVVIGSSMSFLGTVCSPRYKQATNGGGVHEDNLKTYFDLIFHALS
jgi:TetR/AcrR family fatty acid metabolism transcriptional regulator